MNPKSLAIWGSLSLALHAGLLAFPGGREVVPPNRDQRLEVGLTEVPRTAELSRAAARPTRGRQAPAPEPAESPKKPEPVVDAPASPPEQTAQAPAEPSRQHPAPASEHAPSAPAEPSRREKTPEKAPAAAITAAANTTPASASPAPPQREPEPAKGTPAGKPARSPDAAAALQSAAASYRAATPDYARNPPPPYPAAALRRRWTGEVWLRVRVTADGDVARARVARSSGYRVLDDAALRAVRDWRFQPARRAGCKVACEVRVPVRFRLAGR